MKIVRKFTILNVLSTFFQVLQYTMAAPKTPKGKSDSDPTSAKQFPPEVMTCHFGFGIDTLRP